MIPTFIISFREFLEVFLIVGVFFGLSKKLGLKREKEIALAALTGIIISFILPTATFLAGDSARRIVNERNAELLEGYLMVFSGFFLVYVIFSLHRFFVLNRSKSIIDVHQKMEQNIFDISLFLTIVFFVVREGFEIALFTATTSLFTKFTQNMLGLTGGFVASSFFGMLTYFSYIKFSIGKVYKLTEYLIILLGAAFVKNGFGELAEVYFNTHLSDILPLKLSFLPSTQTFLGHALKSLTGFEQNFSLVQFSIMAVYIAFVYFLLMRPSYKKMR